MSNSVANRLAGEMFGGKKKGGSSKKKVKTPSPMKSSPMSPSQQLANRFSSAVRIRPNVVKKGKIYTEPARKSTRAVTKTVPYRFPTKKPTTTKKRNPSKKPTTTKKRNPASNKYSLQPKNVVTVRNKYSLQPKKVRTAEQKREAKDSTNEMVAMFSRM